MSRETYPSLPRGAACARLRGVRVRTSPGAPKSVFTAARYQSPPCPWGRSSRPGPRPRCTSRKASCRSAGAPSGRARPALRRDRPPPAPAPHRAGRLLQAVRRPHRGRRLRNLVHARAGADRRDLRADPCGTGLAAVLIGPWMTVLVTVAALAYPGPLPSRTAASPRSAPTSRRWASRAPSPGISPSDLARRCGANLWVGGHPGGRDVGLGNLRHHGARARARALRQGVGDVHVTGVALGLDPAQLPLGLLEGVMTAGALAFLRARRPDILDRLQVVRLAPGAS